MTELRLADAALEIARFEEAASLAGGGQVSLGSRLSAHASAEGFRRLGASGTVRNYKLRDVVLDGDSLTLFKDGIPVSDTFYLIPGALKRALVVRPEAVVDPGDDRVYIIACNTRHHHYGHWMMQCLPAIDWSLRNRPETEVCLVMRDIEPWQEDTLNLLGYGSISRLVPAPGAQYRFARAEYSEFINGAATDKISLCLADTAGRLQKPVDTNLRSYRALYVPLTKSFYGDIANEVELADFLARQGVHVVAPASLPISERMSLFRNADLVIGPHSEDLADIMFCKPGAVLWEWMPGHYQNLSNNRLAQSVGLHYWADLFETTSAGQSPDWVVDLNIVAARFADMAQFRAAPVACLPVRGTPLGTLMTHFESLGDNCEFGLVQRQAYTEPLGLLRFASFEVPLERRLARLTDALEKSFDGFGHAGAIAISAEGRNHEFMVRETTYRLFYHTFRHEGETDIETLRASEPGRLGFLRRKFLDDLASGEKIFVWHSRATTTADQIAPLLRALCRHGANTLLWVVEADTRHSPGSVEALEGGLIKGYVARFAPPGNATDIDAAPWFEVCRKAYELCRGGNAEAIFVAEQASGPARQMVHLAQAAPSALGASLRSWLKSTITPGTTPDELRAKGRYFLAEAAKAEGVDLRSEFRSLAYAHFELADEVAAARHDGAER